MNEQTDIKTANPETDNSSGRYLQTMVSVQKFHLITYGCGDKFDIKLFKPIKNRMHTKPEGGLWGSPVDCEYGWRQWCEDEGYGDLSSKFKTNCIGNTLIINHLIDLNNFIWQKNDYCNDFPDYEKMLKSGVDIIYLTESGQRETRFSNPGLYGYDCESVLIMNPACILTR